MAKVTLIKRTEPFCGGCMIQQAQLDGEGIEYETVDITETPEAVERFDVSSLPIVLIEKDDGTEVRFEGFRPAEEIRRIIEE